MPLATGKNLLRLVSDEGSRCKLTQNEIIEIDFVGGSKEEGVEMGRGQRFIRWTFERRLVKNDTLSIMEKSKRNINSAS